MPVLVTCMNTEDLIKVFPIITLWELSVAIETRVLIRSGAKPNAAFSPPNDTSVKILFLS